jgi:RNA polymerase sigma-70 factor, ECF subfamily
MTFRETYDAHFDFVWRTLRRLGVREADAADAAQEVFVVVHRRLAEFEGRARLTTWLFRICLNVARDRQRLAHVRSEVLGGEDPFDFADGREGAEQVLLRRERASLLEAALESLDLDQRAVFAMFELEEMPGEEIAEALGIPMGTVWSRLRLARNAFRKAVARLTAREAGAMGTRSAP